MVQKSLFWLISIILVVLFISPATYHYAQADEVNKSELPQLKNLRENFKKAEKALKIGQWSNYQRYKATLSEYPLLAYLEYAEIDKIDNSPSAIKAFIDKYPNFPSSRVLYKKLLEHYYDTNNWNDAINYNARGYDVCLYLLSLHRLKKEHEEVMSSIKELWLDGHYLDEKCSAIIKEQGLRLYQNRKLLWDRIAGALKQRNWRTIREISSHIHSRDRYAYNSLLRLKRNKRAINRGGLSKLNSSYSSRVVIAYALGNYPSDYIKEAYNLYIRKIRGKYEFSAQQTKEIEYNLGLFLTIENEKEGIDIMRTIDPKLLEEEEHEWRARSAIKFAQWRDLINFIDDFPQKLKRDSTWLYWTGYALEKISASRQAKDFFTEAARDRSFYGFLAAEKLGAKKSLNNSPANPNQGKSVLSKPSFQRFFELDALDRNRQALREWEATLRITSRAETLYLASAAYSKNWFYHTIRAFATVSYWDDLQRRFPLPYQEEVLAAARKNRLAPSLVYAIIRTESSFRPNVASSAGAIGLMQLLPSTARRVIHRTKYKGSKSLINPKTSIDVGSAYLRQLIDKSKGNIILALASYNAGPKAAKEWLPQKGESIPAIEWIETVPYGETRKYLRSILYSQAIFDWRLGKKNTYISKSLQPLKSG